MANETTNENILSLLSKFNSDCSYFSNKNTLEENIDSEITIPKGTNISLNISNTYEIDITNNNINLEEKTEYISEEYLIEHIESSINDEINNNTNFEHITEYI